MIDYYARMAAEQDAYCPPPPGFAFPCIDGRAEYPLRMVAPLDCSTVQLISGRMVSVPPDRIVFVDEDEAKPLRAAPGWRDYQGAAHG